MRARGFTLIEMAIVITIIGLLLSSFLAAWKVYQKQRERDTDNAAISQISAALNRFFGEHNYFPCPSGPILPIGHAARGLEVRFVANTEMPAGASISLGRCSVGPSAITGATAAAEGPDGTTGIRRVAGYRVNPGTKAEPNTITAQSYPGAIGNIATADTSVFIGAIPYVTLGLPERFTYDSRGMKLTYVVSATAAHFDTFDPTKNNITVQRFDFNHASPTSAAKTISNENISVSYTIFSGGADRLGVYAKDGTLPNPCAAIAQAAADFSRQENCDNDALFLRTFDTNTELSLNTASISRYFDDIISSQAGSNASIWEAVPSSTTGDVRNVNLGNIGIGANPHSKIRMDVSGDVRADKTISNFICATGVVTNATTVAATPNSFCFKPQALAGNPDLGSGGIRCTGGKVLSKIGRYTSGASTTTANDLMYDCITPNVNLSNVTAGVCAAGKTVIGFNTNGTICCTGDTCF